MRPLALTLALVALLPVGASPQATTNEIYVLAAVYGQATYQLQTVRLDKPLTLVADAAGVLHLGTVGTIYTWIARGEVPAATPAGWQLAHVPIAGASCFRNGLYQSKGVDYTLAGAAITSTFWMPGDTIACDYEWAA